MRRGKLVLLFLFIFVMSGILTAQYNDKFYASGNVGYNNFIGGDMKDYQGAPGVGVSFGYYLDYKFAAELEYIINYSHDHDDNDDVTLDYSGFSLSGKYYPTGKEWGIFPFGWAGFGMYKAAVDMPGGDETVDGTTVFFGGGFDYYIRKTFSLEFNIRYMVNFWDDLGNDEQEGNNLIPNICLRFHF